MITRQTYLNQIKTALAHNPVVGLIGPRQIGKTTLAHELIQTIQNTSFFDLENPAHLARLHDPMLALQNLHGLVVIDEIQHQPDLFKVLRVLADRPKPNCKFLVLGSASPVLLKQSSESLAGRISYIEVKGFSIAEVGVNNIEKLWLRGSFPRAFLASSNQASINWRQDFIRTFLERDIPQLGITIPTITLRRFWMMIAHYHGQLWNSSEFARAFGMSDKTVRNYLDILTSTFVVRQIQPWWENISKRQVKAPKVYLNDSGILHTLLNLNTQEDVESHPKVGASWEGFALNSILTYLKIPSEEAFYWRTHSGAEIDLLLMRGNKRIGFEFKRTVAPQLTRSMHIVSEDLKLTHLYVVHGGSDSFPLSKDVTALSLFRILDDLKNLFK